MLKEAPHIGFQQALQTFTQASASEREVRLNYELFHKWKDVYFERQRMLDALLEERGLAICSQDSDHYSQAWMMHNGKPDPKEVKPEEFGIFPKSEMRLHFRRFTARAHQGHPSLERLEQFQELELLCPKHFPKPKDTNKSWGSNAEERYKRGNDMESKVLKKDGRLVTVVDNVDVTHVLVERGYLGRDEIYQHLGLPELPAIPRWIDDPYAPYEDYREATK